MNNRLALSALSLVVSVLSFNCSGGTGSGSGGGSGGGNGGGTGQVASGLTLVQGEVLAGDGPTLRQAVVFVQLTNRRTTPLSLLAHYFKLRMSSGVEIAGSDLLTPHFSQACPMGDVSVGATVACRVAFRVDLSSATITGVSYTLPDLSQWVVDQAIPTCEQCGLLQGCAYFQYSDWACGGCGVACTGRETCFQGTCVTYTSKNPTAPTCAETCSPQRCITPAYSAPCEPPVGTLTCTGPLAATGCASSNLWCQCG